VGGSASTSPLEADRALVLLVPGGIVLADMLRTGSTPTRAESARMLVSDSERKAERR